MSVFWKVASDKIDVVLAAKLATLDNCFSLDGKIIAKDPKSTMTIHESGDNVLYVKKYMRSGKFLRKYVGRSRLRAEWENLLFFESVGIRIPPMLAWGEERRGLYYIKGALVTSRIDDSSNLLDLHHRHSPLVYSRDKFRVLAAQVADFTRRLHQHGFAHNDLNWRNILVSCNEASGKDPLVYFFDCPSGRFWRWPFLEYRIVKDLAHLDKVARHCIPLRWRLWFYLQYTGHRRLTRADKRRLRKVARYFDS